MTYVFVDSVHRYICAHVRAAEAGIMPAMLAITTDPLRPARPFEPPAPASADAMLCERCGARCTGCTPSGAARRAASRPTAAAGDAKSSRRTSTRRTRSSRPTASACSSWSRELRERSWRRRARAAARSTCSGTASRASCRSASASSGCSIAGSPFLELSPLAAIGMYDDEAPARRPRHRHRPRLGPRGADRRQRRHGQGRHLLPDHRQEAPARAADRAREPPAVRLSRRFGRRVPAAAGRGLSRPRALRPHLLQPGAHVGRAHPADRRRHGLVHGRRRLRAGDVGRNDHRQGHRARSFWAARRS